MVKTRPINIAWPANVKDIAMEILDHATDGDTRPLLVHAFSINSHVYAEMLDLMDTSEGGKSPSTEAGSPPVPKKGNP